MTRVSSGNSETPHEHHALQEAEEKEKIQRGIATLTEKLQKITGQSPSGELLRAETLG